ncbi:hypothetical protein NQZ68_029004 [Dissostichus eleginoides]|nr:hypothetical protein NQZ68_029004 [Dissostichus eleginoides]
MPDQTVMVRDVKSERGGINSSGCRRLLTQPSLPSHYGRHASCTSEFSSLELLTSLRPHQPRRTQSMKPLCFKRLTCLLQGLADHLI